MILTLLLAYLGISMAVTLLIAAFLGRTRERVAASLPVHSNNVVPLGTNQDATYGRRAA